MVPSSRSPEGADHVRGVVSRRRVLAGAAALLGGGMVASGAAGCAVGPGRGAGEISYWHLLTGGDGAIMAGLVDTANERGLGFHATQTVLAWGPPYYTKLAMASAGGRAPDVAVMHASRIGGYARGGLLDEWDLGLLAENGVSEDTFPERVWQQSLSDGKLYAVALDAHPFIMFYNTEIAAKAGVLGPDRKLEQITRPEQFVAVARAMQGVTGDHGLSYGYLGDGAQMWRLFYTFYRQLGAEMVLVPGQRAKVDEAAAVTALQFIRELLDDTVAARSGDYGTALSEFVRGGSGLFFSGVWELPTLATAKVPFDAQPIPTLFGTPATYADSHTFVLPRRDEPDPDRRRLVYRFVAELLKSSLTWAGAGHIPAYLPVVNGPNYAELVPQAHYATVPDQIIYDPEVWFSGAGSDFQNYFAENVQSVLLAGQDPAQGFRGFVDRLNILLSKPQPV